MYERISDSVVTGASFTDWNPQNGTSWYMVRAVRLEETPSGNFYNTSTGVSDSVSAVVTLVSSPEREPGFRFMPNPARDEISVYSFSSSSRLLQILNNEGKVLQSILLSQPVQRIDLSALPAGFYLLRADNEVRKLVKQ
jgi:hypothetical protein